MKWKSGGGGMRNGGAGDRKAFGTESPPPRRSTTNCSESSTEHRSTGSMHYLGKETVQNIPFDDAALSNGLFEPTGTATTSTTYRSPVDEKIGVGHRAQVYRRDRRAGADMVPNHLVPVAVARWRWSHRQDPRRATVQIGEGRVLTGSRPRARRTRAEFRARPVWAGKIGDHGDTG